MLVHNFNLWRAHEHDARKHAPAHHFLDVARAVVRLAGTSGTDGATAALFVTLRVTKQGVSYANAWCAAVLRWECILMTVPGRCNASNSRRHRPARGPVDISRLVTALRRTSHLDSLKDEEDLKHSRTTGGFYHHLTGAAAVVAASISCEAPLCAQKASRHCAPCGPCAACRQT